MAPRNLLNDELLPLNQGGNGQDFPFIAPAYNPAGTVVGNNAPSNISYDILAGSPEITWTADGKSATETYIMTNDAVPAFVAQAIGMEVAYYQAPFMMRRKRTLPGNPDLVATRISARPFEDERPGDPYLVDKLAFESREVWNQRYSRLTQVTIEYSVETGEPYLDDFNYTVPPSSPELYTEKKVAISAEFINVGQQNTYFASVTDVDTTRSGFTRIQRNAADPNWAFNRSAMQYLNITEESIAKSKVNDGYELANSKVVPTRDITLIWRHVFNVPYQRIRSALGKVNTGYGAFQGLPMFDYAPPETVLFIGANVTKENLLAPDGRKLYTVEYRFIEKIIRVYTDGVTEVPESAVTQSNIPGDATEVALLGWNHYWHQSKDVNGGGWVRLVVNKATGESPYKTYDFRDLFFADPHNVVNMPLGTGAVNARRARSYIERGTERSLINPLI